MTSRLRPWGQPSARPEMRSRLEETNSESKGKGGLGEAWGQERGPD